MRKVMVRHHVKGDDGKWYMTDKGEAIFHAFGTNYEEFEGGPGNFSTAIVEYADGLVDNVPVEHVRFLTPNDNHERREP